MAGQLVGRAHAGAAGALDCFGAVGGADQNEYNISVNTGASGGQQGWVWYRNPANGALSPAGLIDDKGSFHPGNRRFPNEVWDKIRSGAELFGQQLQIQRELGRDSVGFARQSVIQCAKQLGIDLNAVPGSGISAAGIKKAETLNFFEFSHGMSGA